MPTVQPRAPEGAPSRFGTRLTAARLIADIPMVLRSPPDAFAEWHRRYGDVVRVPLTWPPMLQAHSPEDILHVLATHRANYRKTGGERGASRLLGRGLFLSRGSLHRRQRAVIEPSFHGKQIASMAETMGHEAAACFDEWPDGEINLASAMGVLTLRILGKTFFAADLRHEAPQVVKDLLTTQRFIHPTTALVLPRWIPTPARRTYERAVARIERVAFDLIDRRRREGSSGDDLLSVLVRARCPDGTSISDQQVRDEVLTVLLAGHETAAAGLSWLWHEVGKRPELFSRLRAEADRVLGADGLPRAGNVRELKLAEATFRETLRLHAPVWAIGRRAVKEDRLPSGHQVPAGAIVTISPYVVHRRSDLFPEPLAFRPDRFLRASRPTLAAGSFIPFGAGPRSCIGEGFATQEASVVVAMLARHWDIEPLDHPPVIAETLVVRRQRHGVWMRLRRRR